MFSRLLFAISFVFLFTNCDFISPKGSSLQNFASVDLIIDFSTVDVYPMFKECKDSEINQNQLQCFEKEIIKKLKQAISKNELEIGNRFSDTVYVDLLVDQQGKISIKKYRSTFAIKREIPMFDSIFRRSVDQLPLMVQPAVKRGIPVNSQFSLPVIISVE